MRKDTGSTVAGRALRTCTWYEFQLVVLQASGCATTISLLLVVPRHCRANFFYQAYRSLCTTNYRSGKKQSISSNKR